MQSENNVQEMENAPGVAESENIMAEGAPKKTDDGGGKDKTDDEKTKMSKKQIIGLVVLSLIALGGVLFGVYGMNSQNDKIAELTTRATEAENELAEWGLEVDEYDDDEVEISDEVEIIGEGEISNELAQNLIDPYLGTFTYLNDIFDHEFDETTKFYVAFNNLKDVYRRGDSIVYDNINREYKYLFGDSKDLDKIDYKEGYNIFTYEDKDWGGGDFVVNRLGGGGTMAGLFSVIKDAYYDGDNIVVEVYHDSIGVCGASDEENYCFNDNSVYRTVIDDEMDQIIENNSDRIPVYKMIFMSNGNHYYLNSINKE